MIRARPFANQVFGPPATGNTTNSRHSRYGLPPSRRNLLCKIALREAPSEPARPQAEISGEQDGVLHEVSIVFQVLRSLFQGSNYESSSSPDSAIGSKP